MPELGGLVPVWFCERLTRVKILDYNWVSGSPGERSLNCIHLKSTKLAPKRRHPSSRLHSNVYNKHSLNLGLGPHSPLMFLQLQALAELIWTVHGGVRVAELPWVKPDPRKGGQCWVLSFVDLIVPSVCCSLKVVSTGKHLEPLIFQSFILFLYFEWVCSTCLWILHFCWIYSISSVCMVSISFGLVV